MARELRCPGYHAVEDARDGHHRTWVSNSDNPPHKRYYCDSCDAYYPYLVDVAKTPLQRYKNTGPMGPVHPDDTNNYGNQPYPQH